MRRSRSLIASAGMPSTSVQYSKYYPNTRIYRNTVIEEVNFQINVSSS